MKIAISAESTIDLTKELLYKYDIKTLPFSVLMGEDLKLDGEVSCDEIVKFIEDKKSLPKTSAVNYEQYKTHFTSLLKDYDAVIHFSLSSELSSAYNNAVNVSKELNNVYIIDSRTLSTGIALLAIYARNLADKNYEPKDIVSACEKRIPFVEASFELKRVDCLYKGGRCGVLSFLGANILKIRPQIIVKNGKMISGKKYRGNYERVVENYVNDILEEFNTPDLSQVFITYTTATKEILEKVKSVLVDYGFKNIDYTRAGATITSHCGEDCLGILYINDGQN